MFGLGHNLSLEIFQFWLLVVAAIKLSLLSQISMSHHYSENPSHIILELCKVLVQVQFATSKAEFKIYCNKPCIHIASGVDERLNI